MENILSCVTSGPGGDRSRTFAHVTLVQPWLVPENGLLYIDNDSLAAQESLWRWRDVHALIALVKSREESCIRDKEGLCQATFDDLTDSNEGATGNDGDDGDHWWGSDSSSEDSSSALDSD